MKRTKKPDFPHKNNSMPSKKLLSSSLIGLGCGIASFAILILTFAGICLLVKDAHKIMFPLCCVALYLSAFISGFSSVIANKGSDALICSSLCGAAYMLTLWSVLAILGNIWDISGISFGLSVIFKLLILLASVVGGFSAQAMYNSQKRNSRRKF